MQYRNLIIEFEGYCMLRQPTDPPLHSAMSPT
jgi:hypothetical protein